MVVAIPAWLNGYGPADAQRFLHLEQILRRSRAARPLAVRGQRRILFGVVRPNVNVRIDDHRCATAFDLLCENASRGRSRPMRRVRHW